MLHSSKQRFFLYIRSRKQPTWQPSHCVIQFVYLANASGSETASDFPCSFSHFQQSFQVYLFNSIEYLSVFYQTCVFIFLYFHVDIFHLPYASFSLRIVFQIFLHQPFYFSSTLVSRDIISSHLLQLSFFVMAESNKHRAAAMMFQFRWEGGIFFYQVQL